jgi:hypothetical protein
VKKAYHSYDDEQLLPLTEDHSTLEWLDYEHLREDIERPIAVLPEKCRLVFHLSREEGLSGKQIATSLDISSMAHPFLSPVQQSRQHKGNRRNVVNIHHAKPINPWINYPFMSMIK